MKKDRLLPYLGGLFDAGGSIKTSRTAPYLLLRLPGPEVLTSLRRVASAMKFFLRVPPRQDHPVVMGAIFGKPAKKFGEAMLPYCREQTRELTAFLSYSQAHELRGRLQKIEEIKQATITMPRTARTQKQAQPCIEPNCKKIAVTLERCKSHGEKLRVIRREMGDATDLRQAKSFTHRRTPTMDELRYLAGFFEGAFVVTLEGTVYANRQTDEALTLFEGIYGGSLLPTGENVYATPHANYRLVAAHAVKQLLCDIQLYTLARKPEIEFAINFNPTLNPTVSSSATHCTYAHCQTPPTEEDLLQTLEAGSDLRTFPPPSSLENAYTAGLLDAEGCFDINYNKRRWCARIKLGQTRPESILPVYQIYGGSFIFEDKDPEDREKPQLALTVAALGSVYRLIDDTTPFLQEKRAQAELLRTFAYTQSDEAKIALAARLALLKKVAIDPTTFPWGGTKKARFTPRDPNAPCAIAGCHRKPVSSGFCQPHFKEAQADPNWVSQRTKTIPFEYGPLGPPPEAYKAWLAGFFDGDGNVCAASAGHLQIVFSQTVGWPLITIRDIYGGSIIEDPPKANKRLAARYQLKNREGVKQFLLDVYPFLKEKKKLVELLFTDWEPRQSAEKWVALRAKLDEHYDRRMTEDILGEVLPPTDEEGEVITPSW